MALEAMLDTDFVSDGDPATLAMDSIDPSLEMSRKRNGSVMSAVGSTSGTPSLLLQDALALMAVDGAKVPVDGVDDQDLKDSSGKNRKPAMQLPTWLNFHRELIQWEAKMDDKVKIQLMNHQSEFEKCESKIAQLEPGSLEGVFSSAESRIQKR